MNIVAKCFASVCLSYQVHVKVCKPFPLPMSVYSNFFSYVSLSLQKYCSFFVLFEALQNKTK